MPIVELHTHFLKETASTFTTRLSKALSYRSHNQLSVVPAVLRKTEYGADLLKRRGWTTYVKRTYSNNGRPGSAISVDFVCTCTTGPTSQCYEVTLTCSDSNQWYENIFCKCNRTRQYGRPCYHASLCLRSPPTSDPNLITWDPQKFDYARPIWYSDKFLVSTMIQQYSAQVKIPSFKRLKPYRIFPPIIYKLPGMDNYIVVL